jgi:hypothetical protein
VKLPGNENLTKRTFPSISIGDEKEKYEYVFYLLELVLDL